MLIISYLNGINHKTVSKQLLFIFIFFISICTPHIILIVSECNTYCKSLKSQVVICPNGRVVRGTRWKVRGAVLVVRILPWIRIFCNIHLFRVHRSWTGSVQMKSSMTFIRCNRCIEREREKDTFKSREVKCLKECALALM